MARSFDSLTRYIPLLNEADSIGEWVFDKENDGSREHPKFMPYFRYKEFFLQFITDVASFDAEYFCDNARTILDANHIEWSQKGFCDADITSADAECVLALMYSVIQLERIHEGLVSSFFRNGSIVRWLSRLKEIDDQLEAAEEDEDYDEFDDEESGSTPSESPCFIYFQNTLKRAIEKYMQMHPSAEVSRFFNAISDELDRFSKGERISDEYWFDLDCLSFMFKPDVIEMYYSNGNLFCTFWLSGGETFPYGFEIYEFDIIERLVSGGAKLSISSPDEFYYNDSDDESEIEEDSE